MPESCDILHEAVELAKLGLAELDAEGRFVSVNSAFVSVPGLREEDLLGLEWRIAVHPEDHGRAEEAYLIARSKGEAYVEIRALGNDSAMGYQALTLTAIKDDRGSFTGYHCLRHDISSYKQDASVLAVESAPNGLLMLNPAGLIQSANLAVDKLFGYTRGELLGCVIEKLVPERFRAHHLVHRDAFNKGEPSAASAGRDVVGLRKDGVEIPVHIYLNRIDTHTGELILCTIIDIDDRVLYQRQMELARQAAEAANRAKSDFLARMSHEIRTPMNLMMGMNTLLLESPLNDKQRQHVEISDRNVRRLLRLINGILDLSKVEAGLLTLGAIPFDLGEVMRECSANMSPAVERKGLEFAMSIDPDVELYWIGDAERVQQVLLNLIGNAVKFTARGKIEVRVRSEQGGQGLRFEVTDTGCGIPAGKADVIFEAFQQAEGSINKPYEGTGLGLSIAKTLVEMMSGKIWLENQKTGSKFVFTAFFPVAGKEQIQGQAEKAEPRPLPPGMRILLVEDNPENVILMRAYLDGSALSIHFASNGMEAVKKRQRHSYDLVFMDVQMPVMDGHTATREIRAWEKAQGKSPVRIVALTAHALSGASAQSIEAGCDGHLTKPVEREELLAAVAKFATAVTKPVEMISGRIAARRPAFLENRRLDLSKMKNALLINDFAAIQHIGHNCKGIGKGYGFPDISTAGSNVECAARALNLVEVEKSIGEFERCLQTA